ncbi:hypothetical protein psal_cds_1422 [Pandoravirus salinus]|uniref:Uncharacterized protein n=1 Tax=Pandoravirus salinus TaxID=1349410 RepID=S4VZR4_9VIRU|nr:hypothetical protein psal_cds_1422 [Pandoravirus salinus]AGO85863.1 hypothetical protein psal_cds_1422 [Pandoravirus salinus]
MTTTAATATHLAVPGPRGNIDLCRFPMPTASWRRYQGHADMDPSPRALQGVALAVLAIYVALAHIFASCSRATSIAALCGALALAAFAVVIERARERRARQRLERHRAAI